MMVLRDENDQRAVYQSKLYQHNLYGTGVQTSQYVFGGTLVALRVDLERQPKHNSVWQASERGSYHDH
jgi:hypothetical protein